MRTIDYKEFITPMFIAARERNVPISGQFELTPLCNLDCKMCYVHVDKAPILTTKQWISLIDDAYSHGMMFALLTGGEAMTHPGFRQIYTHLIDLGVSVRLKTNGILLDDGMLDLLSKYPPCLIDVSLYGYDDASYIQVTGKDVFALVYRNVKTLIDRKEFNVRLMITTSRYSYPFYEEIMKLAKTFGVHVIVNDVLVEADEATGRERTDYGLSAKEMVAVAKKGREYFPRESKKAVDEGGIVDDDCSAGGVSERELPCNGGRCSFGITWEGKMTPCLSYVNEICGHPLEEGFLRSWEAVNTGVRALKVPVECMTCAVKAHCSYCPALHVATIKDAKPDARVCEYKKMRTFELYGGKKE